jgi:GT2 family glycosyltransferase
MKSAFRSSDVWTAFQQIKKQGFFHTMHATLWRFRMALAKFNIKLQDKFGWYSYSDWISKYEGNQDPPLKADSNLGFSFLIIYSGNPSHLADTLDALLAQSYPKWDAYIYSVDTDSQDPNINLYQAEPRIHFVLSPVIPPQVDSNQEFTGDWLGFLNAGDTLALNSLASMVSEISLHPNVKIIYTDMDKLSPDGSTRHSPSFWPDWSPELLLSVNYLGHALFHRYTFSQAAALSESFEDTLLRCTETVTQISHIPRVLFHVREAQSPAWFRREFHPTSLAAHLERSGCRAVSVHTQPITNLPQFSWSFGHPLVSMIILTRDQVVLLERCIESILTQTSYTPFEIILVENNSQEKETFSYYERLKSNPRVKVLTHDQPFNYSAFNNWGVIQAQGDLLLFLNNDIESIESGWLEEMACWASNPEVGAVGAKLLYPNHTIQHAGLVVGLEGHANHIFADCQEIYSGLFGSAVWYRDYSAVTGACMMMRRNVFEQIGGFNEEYHLAFNDIEICLRTIQAGYRVVYTPFSRLVHHEGATRSTYKPSADIKLATLHLKPLIQQGDPFYNPNISLMNRIPTLRRPNEVPPLQRLEMITKYMG